MDDVDILGAVATAYGLLASVTALFQARQMLVSGRSCDVSARFFSSYVGGYLIWLAYGLAIGSWPLIVVDLVGLVCGGVTLAVILLLRRRCAGHDHDAEQAAVSAR